MKYWKRKLPPFSNLTCATPEASPDRWNGGAYIKTPFKVREGYLDRPTAPGPGVELDVNAMAGKLGHDWTNQQSYDEDDGSVVDW